MAKIFYKQILKGAIALEDVPEKWRSDVEKMIESGGKNNG